MFRLSRFSPSVPIFCTNKRHTTIDGMDSTSQSATCRLVLIAVSAVVIAADAQSPIKDRVPPQDTQVRGFWVDSSTGLMWAGKDNGKDVSWRGA